MKYVIIVCTLVNQLEYVVNAQIKNVCPFPHFPDFVKSVLTYFAIVHVSEIDCQTVYDNSKSCDTCGQWFTGPVLD